ncbi:MAG: cytochrome c [Flavobacteriales bacterium]|nr:cytochrome c [Flavobacteriales bacterium]
MLQILIPLLIIGIVVVIYPKTKAKSVLLGESVYKKHCANCHGLKGEGLRLLIPPLGDPRSMQLENLVCTIRYGKRGEILVFGQTYNRPMPGNYELENDEITALINYLYSIFPITPTYQAVTLSEVNGLIQQCK